MKKENKISLDVMCKHISDQEVKAQKASRESTKYMQCVYLEDKIGKTYTAIVSSIQDYGIFCEIPDIGCDVLVKLSDISGNWVSMVDTHLIKESVSGKTIRLGDEVNLFIKSVNIDKRMINAKLF